MALGPAHGLQRLDPSFFLDEDDLVEGPRRPLVALDRECAEHDRIAAVRVIDRAARLAVHQRDFTVLVLVVGDDVVEVRCRQFFALLDLRRLLALCRADRLDALVVLTTFTVTLLVGPERGILAGVAAAWLCYLWRTRRVPVHERLW